jgi:hypothetical protein
MEVGIRRRESGRKAYSALEAVQMKGPFHSPNKLARQRLAALIAGPRLTAGRTAAIPLARPIPLGALAGVAVPGSWRTRGDAGP